MLANDEWHEMFCSPIYQQSVAAVTVTLHHSLIRNLYLVCCCRHTCHLDRILSSIYFSKVWRFVEQKLCEFWMQHCVLFQGPKVEIPATLRDGTTTLRSWDPSCEVTHLVLPWLQLRWKQPEKKCAMPWTCMSSPKFVMVSPVGSSLMILIKLPHKPPQQNLVGTTAVTSVLLLALARVCLWLCACLYSHWYWISCLQKRVQWGD